MDRNLNYVIENKEKFLISVDPYNVNEPEHGSVKEILKVVFMILFIIFSTVLGMLPTRVKSKFLKNFVVYSNTFISSFGFATVFLLVLPISQKKVADYFEKNGGEEKFGALLNDFSWSLVAAFLAYSLSLILQKIAFSDCFDVDNKYQSIESGGDIIKIDEENEMAFKNVVGSGGRFGTFLSLRNLQKVNEEQGNEIVFKERSSVIKASLILSKTMNMNIGQGGLTEFKASEDDMNLMVNPKNINVNENKSIKERREKENKEKKEEKETKENEHKQDDNNKPSTPLVAYLLLGAISLHGFFQGFTIGVLTETKSVIAIGICFLIYKSLEALSLGVVLDQVGSGINSYSRITIILSFSMFAPLGILIGTMMNINDLAAGVMMGVCVGSVLYQCVTEVLVQEFTFTKQRYTKFFIFFIGFALILTVSILLSL